MNSSNQNSVKQSTKNDSPNNSGLYKEFRVWAFYNDKKTQIFCHSEDQKTLFIVLNISKVGKEWFSVNGNIIYSIFTFPINNSLWLPHLPQNAFELVKIILGGTIKTITGTQSIIDGSPSSKYRPKLISIAIKAFRKSSNVSTKDDNNDNSDTIATYSYNYCGCCDDTGKCTEQIAYNSDCSYDCERYFQSTNCGDC